MRILVDVLSFICNYGSMGKIIALFYINLHRVWYTYDVHFEIRQKWDVISGRPIFASFIKENCICAMTRHHAEPNINILLTRNLPFDSDIRQWSHAIMIPSIACGLNWTIERMSIWMWRVMISFLFWFHSFTWTVRLLFHSLFTFSSCENKTG